MSGVFAAAAVIVPIVELVVFALVADTIGVLPTVLLLIAISVVGAVLLVRAGIDTFRRLRETVARREVPTDELTDAALLAVGALLLLLPGFFTDVLAFLVVIPATRRGLRGILRRVAGVFAATRLGWGGKAAVAGKKVYDVKATKVATPGSVPAQPPRQLPSSGHLPDEDDSPSRG